MNDDNKRRLLVALDGSDWSERSIAYLSRLFPSGHTEIHLFHVFSEIPECFRDLDRTPETASMLGQLRDWERAYRRDITEFLEQAQSRLAAAGFAVKDVPIRIHGRSRGIARDIIDEAGIGYTALVAGKKGAGDLAGTTLGSVAAKLVEKADFIPLILTDRMPASSRVLVAVDGSPGSDGAVRYAARVLGSSDCHFVLANVVRGFQPETAKAASSSATPAPLLVREVESSMVLEDARDLLIDSGVDPDAVTLKRVTGTDSRAGALIRTAGEHGCDTVILGRRGWSDVAEFSIGRVAWKSLHTAAGMAVWVISRT